MSRRRTLSRGAMAGVLLVLAAGFVALGIWQVERRAWKHALVAAVDVRAHAAAVAPPGPEAWSSITLTSDGYRRVQVSGRFLSGRDTLVQAVTERGPGFWVLTPLDTGNYTVLVNRGFVPQDRRGAGAAVDPLRPVTVTGLLRITEPGGGFLRRNDPAANRWYSRDVAAIARARGLGTTAPYFIDAGFTPAGQFPVGGLTVISFPDNHAIYALTWFGLALLCLWGLRTLFKENAQS